MVKHKALVFGTLATALAIFVVATVAHLIKPEEKLDVGPRDTVISTGSQAAPAEIMLVEDFQCRNCMAFSRQVIPKIRSELVEKGKARFVLVPVSFLAGQHKIAMAVMEVHAQAPGKFFSYLEAVLEQYEGGDLKTADLIRLARRDGGINLAKLQQAIEGGAHRDKLEKNLHWARSAMGAKFKTPALYVNGSPGSTFSFEAIQYQVEQMSGKP